MFDNYLFVVGIILALWLGAMLFYIITSRQQGALQDEIESLERALEQMEQEQMEEAA